MTSKAFSPTVVSKAFQLIEQTTNANIMTPETKQQEFVLEYYKSKELTAFLENELKGKVDPDPIVINNWLEENGYQIRLLETTPNPIQFCVASILEVLTKWTSPGIREQQGKYSYFYLDAYDKRNIEILYSPLVSETPIFSIKTENGDVVYLLKNSNKKEFKDDLEMMKYVSEIRDSMHPTFANYTKVHIPCVSLGIEDMHKVDINWLIGIYFGYRGTPAWTVVQAVKQIKFKMNENGTEVKTACAMCVSGSWTPCYNDYYFDEPFLLWICRPNTSKPYFMSYLEKDSWISSNLPTQI